MTVMNMNTQQEIVTGLLKKHKQTLSDKAISMQKLKEEEALIKEKIKHLIKQGQLLEYRDRWSDFDALLIYKLGLEEGIKVRRKTK